MDRNYSKFNFNHTSGVFKIFEWDLKIQFSLRPKMNCVPMLDVDKYCMTHVMRLLYRQRRLVCQSARRRLPLRQWRRPGVQPGEQHRADLSRAPARHGGLQVALQRHRADRLVGAQLLLQVSIRLQSPPSYGFSVSMNKPAPECLMMVTSFFWCLLHLC